MDDSQISRAPKLSWIRWGWFWALTSGALLASFYLYDSTATPGRETLNARSLSNAPPLQNEKQKAAVVKQRTESVRVELIRSQASQTGRASWYKLPTPTASGDAMDDDALTAAHPFLPLGAKVLVENLDNGRSVVVRINDRGPFAHNRIIDVSRAAAEKLDMIADGVANVRVSRVVGALVPGDRAIR
jgi:rare lipoprotein A